LVKLIGIPPDAHDLEDLKTRTVFDKCLGKVFEIAAVEKVEGTSKVVFRLDVGRVVGDPAHRHTIWVEAEYLEARDSH
jgi:hypothetical protein